MRVWDVPAHQHEVPSAPKAFLSSGPRTETSRRLRECLPRLSDEIRADRLPSVRLNTSSYRPIPLHVIGTVEHDLVERRTGAGFMRHYYGEYGFDMLTHAKAMLVSLPDVGRERRFSNVRLAGGQCPPGKTHEGENYSLMATPLKLATPIGFDVVTGVRSP